jgi:hypothetical protein
MHDDCIVRHSCRVQKRAAPWFQRAILRSKATDKRSIPSSTILFLLSEMTALLRSSQPSADLPTVCRFHFAEFAVPPRLYLRYTPLSSLTLLMHFTSQPTVALYHARFVSPLRPLRLRPPPPTSVPRLPRAVPPVSPRPGRTSQWTPVELRWSWRTTPQADKNDRRRNRNAKSPPAWGWSLPTYCPLGEYVDYIL